MFKEERKKFLRNCLLTYVIIFDQKTFFDLKSCCELYFFYYNTVFKGRALVEH